jgi:intein/homing endonuclease
MYGAWGVKKGYLPFMPGAMCLVGDSQISFSYGFTRKIKDLVNTNNLWSYNKGQVVSDGNGLKYNGKKEVVKITLIDGRTLRCTPDHKIMTTNGWVEAGKLLSKQKVIVGFELPEDIAHEDEKKWQILDYTMDTPNNREKTLAFCRILGIIITNFIYTINLENMLDAIMFINDIKLVFNEECKFNEKDNKIIVHIPEILMSKIERFDFHQSLFNPDCPSSAIREFLGGLFGNLDLQISFSDIKFNLLKYKNFENIVLNLFNRFGITVKQKSISEYIIIDPYLFSQKIGIRYSINKNYKLSTISSYQRYVKNSDKNILTKKEYIKIIDCEYWITNKLVSPCLYLDVVDVRYDGIEDVYDIIDVPNHSFLSNGIVVHNCTTYMGRTNIEIVADTIQKKYKGELVYGDSVTGDTPILCRIDGKIYYKTIDNLDESDWETYRTEKEQIVPSNIEVWTDNGFTKIKRIIRHKTKKEIVRVLTHTGVVDATEDHGLLNKNSEKISPKEIFVNTELLIKDLPIDTVDYSLDIINKDIAFVMGLFYADGSCGNYECPSGNKSSWAINKSNRELLEKCENILNNIEKNSKYEIDTLNFKILETMESSKVLKLVPHGTGINKFVKIWRELFYDKNKYKKVPDEILWSTEEIRQNFLDGYYSGDGDKDKNNYYRFDNKGKIGSSGLYFLASSLNYKVSINTRKDKPEVYRLTCTKGDQRKSENMVKKIYSLGFTDDYVYDLETENHHFSAGIGKLIIHNTDSNYIHFEHLKTAQESWDYALKVADEVSALFPPPIKLDFESIIYEKFCILTKKRYMYKSCGRDGIVDEKIGKKGVLLARRDCSVFIRSLYEQIIKFVFDSTKLDDMLYFLIQELNNLCSNTLDKKNFVITKAVGDTGGMQLVPFTNEKGVRKVKVGSYILPLLPKEKEERESQLAKKEVTNEKEYYKKCLPAVVQLAEKMRNRGMRVDNGSRLEYVITDTYNKNDKQYDKLESIDYFNNHSDILKIDFMYYLKLLINPLDEVLNIVYKDDPKFKKDFIAEQYKIRNNRIKVLNDVKGLFEPKIQFV